MVTHTAAVFAVLTLRGELLRMVGMHFTFYSCPRVDDLTARFTALTKMAN